MFLQGVHLGQAPCSECSWTWCQPDTPTCVTLLIPLVSAHFEHFQKDNFLFLFLMRTSALKPRKYKCGWLLNWWNWSSNFNWFSVLFPTQLSYLISQTIIDLHAPFQFLFHLNGFVKLVKFTRKSMWFEVCFELRIYYLALNCSKH